MNDLADENFKKLKELFPNAVTETIDVNGGSSFFFIIYQKKHAFFLEKLDFFSMGSYSIAL